MATAGESAAERFVAWGRCAWRRHAMGWAALSPQPGASFRLHRNCSETNIYEGRGARGTAGVVLSG
eukprot:scaffold4454_cov411-Prasinococcus_capsulatus_cf.AAC.11